MPQKVGLVPMLAAAMNYFPFTFSRKVYVEFTCYRRRSLSSLNFLNNGITFAHKFQYLGKKKSCNIFNYFFVTKFILEQLKLNVFIVQALTENVAFIQNK